MKNVLKYNGYNSRNTFICIHMLQTRDGWRKKFVLVLISVVYIFTLELWVYLFLDPHASRNIRYISLVHSNIWQAHKRKEKEWKIKTFFWAGSPKYWCPTFCSPCLRPWRQHSKRKKGFTWIPFNLDIFIKSVFFLNLVFRDFYLSFYQSSI